MGWKRRKWHQQHEGDCHYRSSEIEKGKIKKWGCTCLEWGKPARTSLKEVKGLSSPFPPFIYSVKLRPCRKQLADSSAPRSPWCIPSRVGTAGPRSHCSPDGKCGPGCYFPGECPHGAVCPPLQRAGALPALEEGLAWGSWCPQCPSHRPQPVLDAATPEALMSNPLMNQLLNCRISQPGLFN